MAGLTFATASAVLKEDYLGPVTDLVNRKTFLLSQVEKNTKDVVGLRANHPIQISRSAGVGARGENTQLPTAGNQGYADQLIPLQYNYGRVQLSGPIIKAMSSDKGSFVRAIDSEMNGMKNDLWRDVNRQCWGTADSVIARCGTTSGSTTVTLDSGTKVSQLRQLEAFDSMTVDIGTLASPTFRTTAGRTTSAVSYANKTFVVSGAPITTANTDYVFRSGSAKMSGGPNYTGATGNSNPQSEITGLQFIVGYGSVASTSTGTDWNILNNVDPATYPKWKARAYTNSGTLRSFSEDLVNQAIMETQIYGNGDLDLLVASDGVSRAAARLMQSMRRNIDNVDLKAGYRGVAWSTPIEGGGSDMATTRALYFDKDCPSNNLYGLSTKDLVEYQMSDWEWMDQDGAVWSRVVGFDAYEATLFKYHELATVARNSHFFINDIQE